MIVGVIKETLPGENRVALVPTGVTQLGRHGSTVVIEAGAGLNAGFTDAAYESAGAKILPDRHAVFNEAGLLCQVRTLGANPEHGLVDLDDLRSNKGMTVIGMSEPMTLQEPIDQLAGTGATVFALELIPRITRAQSMDVLSSQATVAGYKAVLLAANELPKMLPMMMTAAGTIAAAHVLVIGAGVAGLQAIATSRRLGAIVHAYDIRPAVKEQVESLGGKFVELEIESQGAEDKGGYAKAMDEEFYRKQQELLAKTVAESDIVITTAAVPGKRSPVLVTSAMVEGMATGSVVVDLAAERGGNCELTRADEKVVAGGVQIFGPTNLPATAPFHASQMFSKNVTTLVEHLYKEGAPELDLEDEITSGTLLARNGEIVHARVREVFGLAAAEPETAKSEATTDG